RRAHRGRRIDDAGAVAVALVVAVLGLARRRGQDLLDLGRVGDALADDQRGDAGDVRRRHRRAHVAEVIALGRVADRDGVLQDAVGQAVAVLIDAGVTAGSGDVDVLAPVRVERGRLVEAGRRHGDHARVRGRITDAAAALVAGGRDDGDALAVRVLARLLEDA